MSDSNEVSREIELWERAKEFEGIPRAESYHELSKIEYEKENYKEALSMCFVAKEIYESDQIDNHSKEIIDLYEGIASIYECLKDCEEAERALQEAIAVAKREESSLLPDLLRYLGRLHFEHKKWQESIEAHLEANALTDFSDNLKSPGVDYLNIGMAYERMKNFELAIDYEKKALKIFLESESSAYWTVNTHAELASAYVGLKIPDEILLHSQIALDWSETEEDYQGVWVNKFYKAVAYRLKGELEIALALLNESRTIAKTHSKNFHSYAVEIDKEIGEIWIEQGKVDSGTELLRRVKNIQDSLDGNHPIEI